MIIKYTVNNNDYTNKIKNFYKQIKFNNSVWLKNEFLDYKDKKVLDKAVETSIRFESLFEKYLYNKAKMTYKEIQKLNFLLDCKFNYFLKTNNMKNLIDNKLIEIVSAVADKNLNGEVIYYFVETDQIVIL